MTKLKLSYFGHIMRRQLFGDDNNAGEIEGSWGKQDAAGKEEDGI